MTTKKSTLAGLHPWVSQTWRSLEATQHEYNGLVRPDGEQRLNVFVGRNSIKRSMMIWDQLLNVIEAKAFKFRTEEKFPFRTIVTVEGEPLSIVLREKTRRIERVPTAAELERRAKFPHLNSMQEWDYRPSGRIVLTIDFVNCHGESVNQVTWADGEKKRIEDRLETFADVLAKIVRDIKLKRTWAEQRNRDQEETLRKQQEAARRETEEKRRKEELVQQAKSFELACSLRRFIEAVRETAISSRGQGESDDSISQWIDWASSHANAIDPIPGVLTGITSPIIRK